jgi:hypothetical protein
MDATSASSSSNGKGNVCAAGAAPTRGTKRKRASKYVAPDLLDGAGSGSSNGTVSGSASEWHWAGRPRAVERSYWRSHRRGKRQKTDPDTMLLPERLCAERESYGTKFVCRVCRKLLHSTAMANASDEHGQGSCGDANCKGFVCGPCMARHAAEGRTCAYCSLALRPCCRDSMGAWKVAVAGDAPETRRCKGWVHASCGRALCAQCDDLCCACDVCRAGGAPHAAWPCDKCGLLLHRNCREGHYAGTQTHCPDCGHTQSPPHRKGGCTPERPGVAARADPCGAGWTADADCSSVRARAE